MQFFDTVKNSTNQLVCTLEGHTISLKREDCIHPKISGNKFRKLKYVFKEVLAHEIPLVVTFGGAHSNHLAATACAGKELGVQTCGIVRGEEWQNKLQESPTLAYCLTQGMELCCISRSSYSQKESSPTVQALLKKYNTYYLIPEGGTSGLGVKGCSEILRAEDADFEVICTSVGTGGTLAGLVTTADSKQIVLGFNALKNPEVLTFIKSHAATKNWELLSDYTFGGYAKTTPQLIDFINTFYKQYQIPLDPVYTGKMLFAIFDMIKNKKWRWGKNILAIHTGGIQGVVGMNRQLQKKHSPLIIFEKELP